MQSHKRSSSRSEEVEAYIWEAELSHSLYDFLHVVSAFVSPSAKVIAKTPVWWHIG